MQYFSCLYDFNINEFYIFMITTDGRGSRNGSHQLSSSSSSRDTSLLDSSQSHSISMPPPSLKTSQSTSSSYKPPMTEEEFMKTLNKIMKDYLKNPIIEVSFYQYIQVSACFLKLFRCIIVSSLQYLHTP